MIALSPAFRSLLVRIQNFPVFTRTAWFRVGLGALGAVFFAPVLPGAITIREVMSANDSVIADEDGDYSDWIELYNSGAAAVDLAGWGLSDNAISPFKWVFPAGTVIQPGRYLLVWASGKDRQPDGPVVAPSALPGLVLWLDASSEVLADGTAMGTWNDRSGKGNHVTQTTAARRPVFRTNAINSRAAIDFNGSTQDFVVPTTTFNGMSSLANFTLLTVLRWDGKVTSGILGAAGPGANAGNIHFEIKTGGLVRARLGNLNDLQVPGALAPGEWNVLGLSEKETGDSPGLTIYRNGGQIGALSGTPGLALMANYQGLVLGNSHNTDRNFDGMIAEFVVFDHALTDTDRRGVERYIAQKYQLGSALHTNFSISSDGEEILLTQPNGTPADTVPPTELKGNYSLGRVEGGDGTWFYFQQSTPGAANTTPAYVGFLDPPTFSQSPGFQVASHTVGLFHPDPQVTIRYTLDGSTPTAASPVYQTPLPMTDRSSQPNVLSLIPTNKITGLRAWQPPRSVIKKANVIRARVEKPGYVPAYTSGTFFVFPQGANQYALPVISIITDRANFFDNQIGLFVPGNTYTGSDASGNYEQEGDAWERPADLEFFGDNGNLEFRQTVGVRIHGGFTRRLPQKSLRIYARSDYGPSHLDYPFFPDLTKDSFKSLILRNSGNDWGGTMFMDAAAQSLVRHFNLDTQAYRPTVVFIDGEYWGIHNIRERYDKDYLGKAYGVDEDNLDMLSGDAVVEEGDAVHYTETLNYIVQNDLSIEANMDQVRTRVDIDNFIDYYCAEIYYGNDDWPHNNIEYWRLRVPYNPAATPGHDGRWRWLLFDADRSLGYLHTASQDMVAWVTRVDNSTRMFRQFLTNPGFKRDFLNRMADHLNSAFVPAVVSATVDRMKPPVETAIAEHIDRWTKPDTVAAWQTLVQGMKTYGNDRPGYLRQHLVTHLGVGPVRNLTLNVSNPAHGSLKVNSLKIASTLIGVPNPAAPYPWTGVYFQTVPVIVGATPAPGYRFAGWQGRAETTSVLTLNLTADTSLTALFELDPDSVLNQVPQPHHLSAGSYGFSQWDAAAAAGAYPPNMVFEQTAQADPALATDLEGLWTLPYNLTSRSRINGLGAQGVSFINTGNIQDLIGAGYVGGARLALDTAGRSQVQVTWTGGTVVANDRIYAIRLQYRVGGHGPFIDVLNALNQPVEYVRGTAGQSAVIGPITLPEAAWNQPYVQLRWKYYFVSGDSGARPQLRLDDITVGSVQAGSFDDWAVRNFPNPADRANPLISGPTVDPRGEGVPNLMRYALGINATDSTAELLPDAAAEGGRLTLAFRRDPAKTDITYIVEAATNLGDWSEILYNSATSSQPNNQGDTMKVSDSVTTLDAPRRFLRLRVTQP